MPLEHRGLVGATTHPVWTRGQNSAAVLGRVDLETDAFDAGGRELFVLVEPKVSKTHEEPTRWDGHGLIEANHHVTSGKRALAIWEFDIGVYALSILAFDEAEGR